MDVLFLRNKNALFLSPFVFVQCCRWEEVHTAIKALSGVTVDGYCLLVSEASCKKPEGGARKSINEGTPEAKGSNFPKANHMGYSENVPEVLVFLATHLGYP